MEKVKINLIKKMVQNTKKISLEICNYALVSNGVLKSTSIENTIIMDVDLLDGMYLLSDLAKGKELIKKNVNDEFPTVGKLDDIDYVINTVNDFKTFIPFTSKDVGILSGVYVSKDGKVATDSHTMKYTTKELADEYIVVSDEALNLYSVLSDETFDIKINNTETEVNVDGITIISTLLVGNYPNFPAVIPKYPSESVTITKENKDVFKTLKKFGYKTFFSNAEELYVSNDFDGMLSDKVIDINNKAVDFGHDTGFNLEYFYAIINSDKVDFNMEYTSNKLPYIFNDTYLLMPIRGTKLDVNNNDELVIR